jgi:hypothetical protein
MREDAMATSRRERSFGRWLAAGVGVTAVAYAATAAAAWYRYGKVGRRTGGTERDALLDAFMPEYDIVERHRIQVRAPATVTFRAASEMDLEASPIIRAILRTREFVMGAHPTRRTASQPLLSAMRAMGWGVLAEIPGREIVMGAVTQPWQADVVFRSLPAAEFAAFAEPGFVKIVWTLRADPVDESTSIFRTETRATPTDSLSRARFRRYWSFVSPGIVAIRWLLLRPVKRDAERRWDVAAAGQTAQNGQNA